MPDTSFFGEQIFNGTKPIHLFPYYQTREEYRAVTGKDAPAWNPHLLPKYWEDIGLSARNGGKPNIEYQVIAVDPVTRNLVVDALGHYYLETMVIPVQEAENVNIPPKKAGVPDVVDPNTGRTIQGCVRMPVRALEMNEYLEWTAFGGLTVKVREKPVQPHDQIVGAINDQDERLKSIEQNGRDILTAMGSVAQLLSQVLDRLPAKE